MGPEEVASGSLRLVRRRQKLRRRKRRRIVVLIILAVLAPVTYSYVTTMIKPSSLPLSVRTIEWIRANHGAWAVNTIERYWYTWHAPRKGGPALKTLPTLGTPVPGSAHRARTHHRLIDWRPVRLRPLIRPALPDEGAWHKVSDGFAGPPLFWSRRFARNPTTRGSSPTLPGSTTRAPSSRSTRAATSPRTPLPEGRSRCRRGSGGACWRRSTAASPTETGTAASQSTARPRRRSRIGGGRSSPTGTAVST